MEQVPKTTTGSALRALLARADVTLTQLAREAGYKGPSGAQRYIEDGYSKPLPPRIAEAAMQLLVGKGAPPVTEQDILDLSDRIQQHIRARGIAKPPPTSSESVSTLPSHNVDMARIETDGIVGARDTPVYASAVGGARGHMIVDFEPIEWVRRPAPLEGVKGGFAVYVQGESMDPAYEHGDMALIHPHQPVRQGDTVLILLTDGNGSHEAMIKRLVVATDDVVRLEQHKPHKTFELPRADVSKILKVVGKYNRR